MSLQVQQFTISSATSNDPPVREDQLINDPPEAAGMWASLESDARFIRQPSRGEARIVWRELDDQGNEVASYEQVEVRCDTRWFWWMDGLFNQILSIPGDQQHVVFAALSVAAAYQLDTSIDTRALGLGPNPLVAMMLFLVTLGAVLAAAVPLTKPLVLLRNLGPSRLEVRLDDAGGFSREPSNRPGYTNPWTAIAAGSFSSWPHDLRAKRARRSHHLIFLSCVALIVASRANSVLNAS